MSNSKFKDVSNLSAQSLKRRFSAVSNVPQKFNRTHHGNNRSVANVVEYDLFESRADLNMSDCVCGDNQNDIEDEYDKSVLSDESDESFDLDSSTMSNINDFLRSWVSQSNVPHMHVNKLIRFLKKNGHPTLPNDCRTLMKTPTSRNVIPMHPGNYVHIGLKNGIDHFLESFANENLPNELKLDFNIDGLPLSKSSSNCFWLILCRICNVQNSPIFVVGIYNGYNKPESFEEFLNPLVDELLLLENEYTFKEILIKLVIRTFICDAPARSSVTGTKGHNAYHGCGKCTIEGEYIENRVAFIGNGVPRTNESFRLQKDEDHHNFSTPLTKLNIDMIKCFPHDYLHVVLLGVVRKMLRMWCSGKTNSLLPSKSIKAISKRLENISKSQPKEFQRKARKLSDLNYYKGSELRTFLLYSGPFVLKNILDKPKYDHFLLLHNSISILCGEFHNKYTNVAQKMLEVFVEDFGKLYGKHNISFNVHALLHISDDVRLYGKLDDYSAFQFESFMFTVKRLLRKNHQCLAQLSNRLSEIYQCSVTTQSNKAVNPILKGKYYDHNKTKMYSAIDTKAFKITSNIRNKWIMSQANEIIEFKYAIKRNEDIIIFGQNFLNLRSFFKTPLDSRKFNIYVGLKNQSQLKSWNLNDISNKLFMMEYEDTNENVFFPLLHNLT